MAQNLLEPLLLSLDNKQRKQIKSWLGCPLHNQRKDLLPLFEQLCKAYPFASTAEPSPLEVADTKQRLRRSYLLDRIEDFLVWQQQEREKKRSPLRLPLLRSYRQLGLEKHLSNRINRQLNQLKKTSLLDVNDLYARYQVEELRQELHLDSNRKLPGGYDQADQFLLVAQLSAALRNATLLLAAAPFTKNKNDFPLLAAYFDLLADRPGLLQQPSLAIYYQLCRYYLAEDTQQQLPPLASLIQLLQQHLQGFSYFEQRDLLKMLLNLAIRQLNVDPAQAHLQQAFELYQLGLAQQLLVDQRRISTFTFNNIMGISIRLGEIDFAQQFMQQYAELLPPQTAGEVIALNQARLAYAEKAYPEALRFLQKADYRDYLHMMNARHLQIRIYYETDEHEVLRDFIRATRSLLSRRKYSYHSRVYRNNLKMTQKLLNLRLDQPKAIQKLRAEIQNIHPLSEREWLLSQLP